MTIEGEVGAPGRSNPARCLAAPSGRHAGEGGTITPMPGVALRRGRPNSPDSSVDIYIQARDLPGEDHDFLRQPLGEVDAGVVDVDDVGVGRRLCS